MVTGDDERQRQRAERDQEVANRAMHDGERLLLRGAHAPDRVERKLNDFPDQVSASHKAEVDTQATQPGGRRLIHIQLVCRCRHRKYRYLMRAARPSTSRRRTRTPISPMNHMPPPIIMSCIMSAPPNVRVAGTKE